MLASIFSYWSIILISAFNKHLVYLTMLCIAIYTGDTTIYFIITPNLWQQLELDPKLESEPQDTVVWGRKWCVDFNAGETQLVLFDQSSNLGARCENGWIIF